MDEAIRTLRLPYTYTLVRTELEKQEMRQKLGMMTADIIEGIRDEILDHAARLWLKDKT